MFIYPKEYRLLMTYTMADYHRDLDQRKEAIKKEFESQNLIISEEKIEFMAKKDLPLPPNDGWGYRD